MMANTTKMLLPILVIAMREPDFFDWVEFWEVSDVEIGETAVWFELGPDVMMVKIVDAAVLSVSGTI